MLKISKDKSLFLKANNLLRSIRSPLYNAAQSREKISNKFLTKLEEASMRILRILGNPLTTNVFRFGINPRGWKTANADHIYPKNSYKIHFTILFQIEASIFLELF